MSIVNRRNAALGYVAMKVIKRKTRRQRRTLKIASLVVLGVLSAGLLVALVAIAMKRHHSEAEADGGGSEEEPVVEGSDGTGPATEPLPSSA